MKQKVIEKSLVIRKENPFDKVRRALVMMFFREEYEVERKLDGLMNYKKVDVSKIVIPKEIKL